MRRRPYILITLGVYLASSLPYLAGYLFESASTHFTWIVFDVVDTAQYYAWMRSFSHGVLIANPLTPEPGAERFFNLQWWLLGLLAFKTPLGVTLTYQLLRIVALAGFAAALAWFCRLVAPRRSLLAFSIIMLGSGLGWLWVVLKQWTGELHYPLDVQISEANAYFSAMAFPHLLVAAALLLLIYGLFLTTTAENWLTRSILVGSVTLALGFSHGYDLIPAVLIPASVAGILLLRERRIGPQVRVAIAIGLSAAPPALYSLGLTRLDATWKGVLSQYGNAGVYSPTPPHLLILLGIPLLLALPRLRRSEWDVDRLPALFVRVWLVVGFFLLYIPTDFQVKMLTAYQIPVGILASQTLVNLYQRLEQRRWIEQLPKAAVPVAVIGLLLLTNLYLTAWRVVDLRRQEYPYYLKTTDVEVLRQLDERVEPGDVVLSSPELGVFVPVYSDARPYVAHWAQSLHFLERRAQARWFFSTKATAGERSAMLKEMKIDYVLAGPAEADMSGTAQLPEMSLDVLINGATRLYKAPQSTDAAEQ